MLVASALLAVLFDEAGADVVADTIAEGASVSAVTWAETAAVLVRQRRDPEPVMTRLRRQVRVVALTEPLALAIAALYAGTRGTGLSLGDRACLALARELRSPAITADRAWTELDLDVPVRLIR